MRKLASRILNFNFPLGLLFVLVLLVLNDWTAARFLSSDGTMELPTRVVVWAIDAIAVVAAALLFYFRVKVPVKILLFNAVFLLLLLALLEGGLYYLVRKTENVVRIPLLHDLKREFYNDEKEFIQYKPGCAQPDDFLGYALTPGTFTFSGAEFSNRFEVNRLGMRDDAQSLEAPGIIVVGDSYAMGWGVDQAESFGEIIEARVKRPVLNTGVSSYGTAREMRTLERVDTTNLETLIIQYCHNDLEENQAFSKNGNQLETMSEKRYQGLVRRHDRYRSYYFGKYLTKLVAWRGKALYQLLIDGICKVTGHIPPPRPTAHDEAREFLNVLVHSGVRLEGVRIIVLELGSIEEQDDAFITALREVATQKPEYGRLDLQTIDVSSLLEPQHFFALDSHINASGHQVVAEAVLETMGTAKPKTP